MPDWSDATVAVGANVPGGKPAGTVTITGIVTLPPEAIVPSEHVNDAGPAVQVPWLGSLETTVEPAGNVAVNVTPVCVLSSPLVTVKVCCTWLPAVTVGGSLTSVTQVARGGMTANVAVTDAFAVRFTTQAPVPSHAPPQPVNCDPHRRSASA